MTMEKVLSSHFNEKKTERDLFRESDPPRLKDFWVWSVPGVNDTFHLNKKTPWLDL